jgi:hypothetical protein
MTSEKRKAYREKNTEWYKQYYAERYRAIVEGRWWPKAQS